MVQVIEILKGVDWALWFGVLWGVSEALSMIPQIKSNGIFQAIWGALVWLKDNVFKK